MVVTLGQQYNVREKRTVILYPYINRHVRTPKKNFIKQKHCTKCLCMVSTNLYMLFYAGEIRNSDCRRLEMATYFFLNNWVRFAKADKAVAVQCPGQWSTDTNVYVEVLPSPLSVDDHKSTARQECATLIIFVHYLQKITDRRRTDVVVCWLPKPHDF